MNSFMCATITFPTEKPESSRMGVFIKYIQRQAENLDGKKRFPLSEQSQQKQ